MPEPTGAIVTGTLPPNRPSSIDLYTSTTDLYPLEGGIFQKAPFSYLLQGTNGPCPLLAIANLMILKGQLKLSSGISEITMDALIKKILEYYESLDEGAPAGNCSKLESKLLPLNRGMNVNINFTSIDGFERTSELECFDLLKIKLYHAWLVSEDDLGVYPYLSLLSYNQATEKVAMCEEIKSKVLETGQTDLDKDRMEILQEGEAIEKWLRDTASQLTSDGIIQLNTRMQQGDLAVLFRNNHFSVIHKHADRLYSLVTDIGFRRSGIMWESLDQLDGDAMYLNSDFVPQNVMRCASPGQESDDFALAMRLQYGTPIAAAPVVVPASNVAVVGQPVDQNPRRKKKNRCVIM
jgi:hypothetical protein